ncbi:MAG: tRNA lysidine(34) synthetase TilS [Hyphomicrobiaceae bacterium]
MAKTDNDPMDAFERDRLLESLAGYSDVFLAVSGGADSTALMHLAAEWAKSQGAAPALHVLSVDHGLRPEAATEVQVVVAQAAELGLPASILNWRDKKPTAGVQAAAREARYGLMLAHMREAVANPARAALVTAHHRDDLAETLIMRLGRGAGVDGLSAIRPLTYRDGFAVLRPLLGVPKSRLRASLEAAAVTWIDDPSNADPRFERVQLRAMLSAARQLGLDSAQLALTAGRMARARSALDQLADTWLRLQLKNPLLHQAGIFIWPSPRNAPSDQIHADHTETNGKMADETAIRALMRVLPAVGGVTEPVRLLRVERLWGDMQHVEFPGATLGNCIIAPTKSGAIAIYREPSRTTLPVVKSATERPLIWDNRFEIAFPSPDDPDDLKGLERDRAVSFRVRPLDREDLLAFDVDPSTRWLPCPIEALYATPAIDDDAGLCAIPALNMHRRGSMAQAEARFTCRFMTERLDRRG